MALTKPILNNVAAFDASNSQAFTFNVVGGSQVVGNTLTIKDNTKEENYLETKIKEVANMYDSMNSTDFRNILLDMEDNFSIHFQKLFNMVAEQVIKKRLYDFKGSRTISNQKFMNLVKQCEKEFECEIDFIDLTITPKLF